MPLVRFELTRISPQGFKPCAYNQFRHRGFYLVDPIATVIINITTSRIISTATCQLLAGELYLRISSFISRPNKVKS